MGSSTLLRRMPGTEQIGRLAATMVGGENPYHPPKTVHVPGSPKLTKDPPHRRLCPLSGPAGHGQAAACNQPLQTHFGKSRSEVRSVYWPSKKQLIPQCFYFQFLLTSALLLSSYRVGLFHNWMLPLPLGNTPKCQPQTPRTNSHSHWQRIPAASTSPVQAKWRQPSLHKILLGYLFQETLQS